MKNLTWKNPEQLFVAQVLINKVKSKCCGLKGIKNYMARTVNYSKKIGKIKAQLDELVKDIENGSKKGEEVVEQKTKTKISDIDFETEDLATLMKIQTRLVRAINAKMKN